MIRVFLAFFTLSSFGFFICEEGSIPYKSIHGKTMGTDYSVTYQGVTDYQEEVSNLLIEINQQLSTYISDSDISRLNKSVDSFRVASQSEHLINVWNKAQQVKQRTDGFFDPTVMPLINYWGFGYKDKLAVEQVDSAEVESIMKYVGLDKFELRDGYFFKSNRKAELDFSAIAKGYAVDVVADLLLTKSIENLYVEIGGEVYTHGVNSRGSIWRIGVNTPKEGAARNEFEIITLLSDKGMASSGNYRNFYIVGDKKYGHTINPLTGYPSINELLGATVIAADCMTADAYATGFMAMGLERALKVANDNPDIFACFFISDDNGVITKNYSNGFVQFVAGE